MKEWLGVFDMHYAKRAWTHWTVGAGHKEGEISEGRENIGEIISEDEEELDKLSTF